MWLTTGSTGYQWWYFAKIVIANMYLGVHHIQSLETCEEVYKYDYQKDQRRNQFCLTRLVILCYHKQF